MSVREVKTIDSDEGCGLIETRAYTGQKKRFKAVSKKLKTTFA